ncbi:MAG: GNAT family N-acetyltransferase [Acidobacteriota bacterium]|nr:GNAT family N-acetyltransferase [Acidobacteriota bacterium]
MAVLKKIRSRLFSTQDTLLRGAKPAAAGASPARDHEGRRGVAVAYTGPPPETQYDIRPLSVAQLDEVWRLDQRCFIDGEAYSRDTFEYLLTSPEVVAYRAVASDGAMVGFIVGLVEPDQTGHVTTIGVAPEHRRRRVAERLMQKIEDGFGRRQISTVRLEVRSVNAGAQQLYKNLGYTVTQRLPRYYSNGGDGLLMLKSLD